MSLLLQKPLQKGIDKLRSRKKDGYEFWAMLMSLPISFLYQLYASVVGLTIKHDCDGKVYSLPKNAIIYCFHPEVIYTCATIPMWKKLVKKDSGDHAVGFHGFLSYIGNFFFFLSGIKIFRFRLDIDKRPYDQIKEKMMQTNGRFYIRTDSGGKHKYGKVNGSLIKMSRETGRPLVAFRQSAEASFTFMGHYFPLPFTTIKTRFSEPISPVTMMALDNEAALQLVQTKIDEAVKR